jgi:hypothetical protein
MDLEYPGPCHHHPARLTAPTIAARSAFVRLGPSVQRTWLGSSLSPCGNGKGRGPQRQGSSGRERPRGRSVLANSRPPPLVHPYASLAVASAPCNACRQRGIGPPRGSLTLRDRGYGRGALARPCHGKWWQPADASPGCAGVQESPK